MGALAGLVAWSSEGVARIGFHLATRSTSAPGSWSAAGVQLFAVILTPRRSGSHLSERLSNLGVTLEDLAAAGFPRALDWAISMHRRACAAVPPDHPYRPTMLSNLGAATLERFDRRGDLADLNESRASLENAVLTTVTGHVDQTAIAINAAGTAMRWHRAYGDLPALRSSIENCARAAAASTGADDRNLSVLHTHWGMTLQTQSESTGSSGDLDLAIDRLAVAVALAEASGGDAPHALTALASALRLRWHRRGQRSDLDDAVRHLDAAIHGTVPDNGYHARRRRAALAVALASRFHNSHETGDLDQALRILQELIEDPADEPSDRLHRSNLAVGLTVRASTRSAKPDDLDRAITLLRDLIGSGPMSGDSPELYLALADALVDRTERPDDSRGCEDDLFEAKRAAAAAHDFLDPFHPSQCRALSLIGEANLAAFDGTDDPAALSVAAESYEAAFDIHTASPRERIRASLLWAHASASAADWASAAAAHRRGISLVPFLLPPGIEPRDGMDLVEDLAEAGPDGIAINVGQNDLRAALVRGDDWRSLLLGPDRRRRAQWLAVEHRFPEAADRLTDIAVALDGWDFGPGSMGNFAGV